MLISVIYNAFQYQNNQSRATIYNTKHFLANTDISHSIILVLLTCALR